MSLLTAVTSANTQQKYFVENIGGPGATAADAPCLKGTTLGAVRIGNPSAGVLIRGDTLAGSGGNRIAGGQTSGGALTIGNSTTSFQNIVLTDGVTTVNTPLVMAGAGVDLTVPDDINLGGDLIFTNGPSGASISGYYSATVAVSASGSQTNPAGLTQGVYLVVYAANTPTLGQQPSGVFYWSGTAWVGNAVGANFTGAPPDCAILPASSTSGATLAIGGFAPVVPGSLFFRKLMN